MKTLDLLVLGTGPAATRVALKCSAAGRSVAIVDPRPFGGTCAWRGCKPKKVLVRATELYDWIARAEGTGVRTERATIDRAELIAFKRSFTDPVTTSNEATFRKAGIEQIHGSPRFVSPTRIEVNEFLQSVSGPAVSAAGTYDDPISLDVRRNVRVVYQIKTGTAKDGVAAGLYYLDKLARAYAELGIGEKDRRIVGVFHGEAGGLLLNDAAYEEESGGNPNGPIIQKLLDSGVMLELCRSTMQSHGWRGKDVRAGVRIVVGAYPRIIDLQLRGFAYIRF